MVSVDVSKLGYTNSIFVDPGVKVNETYYRDMLLSQQLLPAHGLLYNSTYYIGLHGLPYIRSLAFLISEFLIVQQDSASAHRTRETFNLIQRETPAFISPDLWSPNNPDHSPVDYQIWGISECTVHKSAQDVDDVRQRLIDVWTGIQQSVIYNAIECTGVSILAFRP